MDEKIKKTEANFRSHQIETNFEESHDTENTDRPVAGLAGSKRFCRGREPAAESGRARPDLR